MTESLNVFIEALDVFVDLMARRPLPTFAEKTRSFSQEDRDIIDLYCKKLGVTHARIAYLIAGRRHALKQELLGVVDELTEGETAIAGTPEMGATEGGLAMPLLTLGIGNVSLEIFHELDVVIDDRITLRVRGDQPGDNRLKVADAARERFDFEPQFKLVIGRHEGVSSVGLWRAYKAHLSGESQAGGVA